MVTQPASSYPTRLGIDYPEKLDRVTTFFRLIWVIPIAVVLSLLSATGSSTVRAVTETGDTLSEVTRTGGGIMSGLFAATVLMMVVRQRYPPWWFDFARELPPSVPGLAPRLRSSPTGTRRRSRSSRSIWRSSIPTSSHTSTGGCPW